MPSVVVAAFWIWTGVSVLILGHRVVTTGSLRPGRARRTTTTAADDPTARLDRLAAFEARLAGPSPDGDPTATTPLAAEPAAHAAPGAVPKPVTTLADALEGIHMPADLTPLVGDRIDPRHTVFATTTMPRDEVYTALAAELERLDFALRPTGTESITATRTGVTIEVHLVTDPGATRADLDRVLSTVPGGAVFVEFVLA